VFVTKYQRALFTDEMITAHTGCADLDVELVEFNGDADHVHLFLAYPPTPAISTLMQRLKGRTAHVVRSEFTGHRVRACMPWYLMSPSCFAVSCEEAPLSIIKRHIEGQARPL
jgi:putative transposase